MLSDLNFTKLSILCLAGFILGLSKSGIKGISIIIVAILVFLFGAKASTGILLPMLIVGDIFAVIYYHRHAQWSYLWKLLPAMVIGVVLGTWVGDVIPEEVFRKSMAGIILISLIMMIWWENRASKSVPDSKVFGSVMGLTAGFTTMVGNLAGSFANLYFLAMRLPKNAFIGTTAWLFLIINVFKVPFHVFSWQTINASSIWISLVSVPFIFLGLFSGVKILKHVNEKHFRNFIFLATGVGAILIFFT